MFGHLFKIKRLTPDAVRRFVTVARQHEPVDSLSPAEVRRGEGRGERGSCLRATEEDWLRQRRAMYHFQPNKPAGASRQQPHASVLRAQRG